MKKFFYLLFIFFSLSLLFSQSNPIVQVDPVINLSDEVWLDAVCDAATDNVLFTLKFLGQFEVVSDSFVEKETGQLENIELIDEETFDTSSLKTRAEAEGYDNILFGSCTIEDGSYVITMNAYDLALDKITYSGSTVVESIFDTFEAVDEITYQTVEGFSGIHVTYGSLVLVPPDTGEPFSFTIDGIALPEGTFSVDRMPAGVHKLAVSQERPFGLYKAVHEIVVEEEIENKIDIPLPDVVGDEIKVLIQAENYLTHVAIEGDEIVTANLDDLNSLLETLFFQNYRSSVVQKYKTWVSILEENILFSEEVLIAKSFLTTSSYWKSRIHRNVSNHIVSLYSQYVNSLKEATEIKSIIIPDIKTISIDGKADDWTDVSQAQIDPVGDADISRSGFKEAYDLVEIKFAIDFENLYVMIRSSDGKYKQSRLTQKIHFHGNGKMFFDFWLAEEYKLSVGLENPIANKDLPWEYMAKKVEFRFDDILEVAIPLKEFINSKVFTPKMGMWLAFEYGPDNHYIIDKLTYTPDIRFPLMELMIKKDEI